MGTPKKQNFVSLIKNYAGIISAILSFFALILSTTQSLISDLTFGAIALLTIATLLLLTYNVWLEKIRRGHKRAKAQRQQRRARFHRWAVHTASFLLLTLSWATVGLLVSDKYAGYLFFKIGQFERAIDRLNSYVASTEGDIATHLKLAECYEQQKNYTAYFNTLEELLANGNVFEALEPDNRNFQIAMIHLDLGSSLLVDEFTEGLPPQSNRALSHLKKARLYLGDNPVLLSILGFAMADTEHRLPNTVTNVKEIFDRSNVIINSYDDDDARLIAKQLHHYWYGRALIVLELYDDAEKELNSALELAPASNVEEVIGKDRILFHLGRNEYHRTDDVLTANKYWERISNDEILRDALRLNGLALWSKGVNATNEGQHEEAVKLYERSEEFLSTAVRMGERSPQLHLQLGAIYFSRQDYSQAAEAFQKLTKMWPSRRIGYYWLGRSKFLIDGGLEDADTAMSRAVELDPEAGDAHYWLGRIAYARDQYDRCIDELAKSLELGYYRNRLHITLVGALWSLAFKTEEYSDEYISLHERAILRAQEGIEAAEVHDEESIVTDLRQIREVLFNSLAYAYAQRKENLSLALSYIDGALEDNPDEPHYLDTKAWILILKAERAMDTASARSDLRDAENLLNHALNLIPNEEKNAQAEILYHLGYSRKLRGEHEGARRLFLRALDLDPTYSAAKAELQ